MIRAHLNRFLTAVMFLTRLPVGRWVRHDPDDLAGGTVYFPVVGAAVGGFGAAALWAASLAFPPLLAVLLSMAATVWVTSAFHEDGLADAADGFGGGWTRDQILDILHDSRIGTYGAVALWFALTVKLFALAELLGRGVGVAAAALVVAHTCGRWSSLWLIRFHPYVTRAADRPKPFAGSVTTPRLLVGSAFTAALAGLLLNWGSLLPLGAAILVTVAAGVYVRRRLGGITGDALGAANQLAELGVYLALAAALHPST